jgi:hypothetical protein
MYSNAQYVSFNSNIVSIRCDINGVTSFVPIDPANVDYSNIVQLVADGKLTIAPVEGG